MSVDGMKDLERKLNALSDMDVKKAVAQGIQMIRSAAVSLCPVDDGELRESIYAEIEQQNESTIGTCWTNKKHGPYVEFGTGPKGQDNHAGISPDITPSYTQSPWWIHESQVDQKTAEKYHWFSIDTPQGKFYQCSGQPAQPFMYPALRDNQDAILKDCKTEFIADIRKAIK